MGSGRGLPYPIINYDNPFVNGFVMFLGVLMLIVSVIYYSYNIKDNKARNEKSLNQFSQK
ncbi:hypothetical protein BFU36_11490 [Sulfolobus sp. A20]|uniref:hypothetical protein n=1 Tax=Sulfolobaceae TaxID=118883 RepID=UPI0008461392|nr:MULTISPECIES: hypothetical protein [unclassified Sulfolobus]AOL17227.1 hypothetical protein BFU36_11490 [Sulfolobus sp. A20]